MDGGLSRVVGRVAPYAAALVLLAGGAAWYASAAPETTPPDPRLSAWARALETALPQPDPVTGRGTATLGGGDSRTWEVGVSIGQFEVAMGCAGTGGTVRVTVGPPDSVTAHRVFCHDPPVPYAAVIGANGPFQVTVEAEQGPAVFRWHVLRVDY